MFTSATVSYARVGSDNQGSSQNYGRATRQTPCTKATGFIQALTAPVTDEQRAINAERQ
jgi:hypothetical protein